MTKLEAHLAAQDKAVARIAKLFLNLDSLETRNSDDLDFKEQAVWSIKAALEEAYSAGRASAAREVSDVFNKGA